MSQSVVAALAELIAETFPDLERRAFAVSEVAVNKERMPRLPACMVALQHEAPGPKGNKLNGQLQIEETVIVDFWLEPKRYSLSGDAAPAAPAEGESVYYAFYPYDEIRDQLFAALASWLSPQGVPLQYQKLECAADSFAVTITFTFKNIWNWCRPAMDPKESEEAARRKISFNCFNPVRTNNGAH
jgi:hypothetical protein